MLDIERIGAGDDLPISKRNVAIASPDGTLPPDVPEWARRYDNPYLQGVFAPTMSEYAAEDLEVLGELPSDLSGAYVLNGPSQRFEPVNRYHFYDGDAMLRAIYFRDGKASFRQRYIRNEAFVAEDLAGKSIWPGIAGPYNWDLPGSPVKDSSNTDIIYFGGKLLSLWYLAGKPYDIDPLTLDTRGSEDFGGKLTHSLSAHSKVDPHTGELFFFTYGDTAPYMRYGVASVSGEVIIDEPIDLPGPRSPHDMGLTQNYAILHDLPFFHDVDLLREHGKRMVRFWRDVPARFGVIPRYGRGSQVRWFEAEPCYVLHVVNCWEDGGWIHQIGCRQPNPEYKQDPGDGRLASMLAQRRRQHELYKWSFNLCTGEVREGPLDDTNTEFPTINANYRGLKSRYSFNQVIPDSRDGSLEGRCQTFNGLIRYDLETGQQQRYDYGLGIYGNEAPVAPRDSISRDAPESDAYVVTFTTDTSDWTSQCLVFDAADIEQGPIARVKIPRRIAAGFHSTWVAGSEIFG